MNEPTGTMPQRKNTPPAMAAADAKTVEHAPLTLEDIYDLLVDQAKKRQVVDDELLATMRNHETRIVDNENRIVMVEKQVSVFPARPLWALVALLALGLIIHAGTTAAFFWLIWRLVPH